MKNLYKSALLTVALAIPMVSGAATVTNEFNLGAFPGTANFGDSTAQGGARETKLPTVGDSFIDNWNFKVVSANSGGEAQLSLTNIAVGRFQNLAAEILNVATLAKVVPTYYTTGLFASLANGDYVLRVTGTVGAEPTSYSGTLEIDGPGATNVPVPAAVWLFGSALVGLMGVSGRKKTLS